MATSAAVDLSAVARVTGIKVNYVDLRGGKVTLLPQRVAVIGQGASASTYSTTKAQYTSAGAVGAAYGYGSPLHLAAKEFFPRFSSGIGTIPVTFYPLDDDVSGVASSGDLTYSGTATESASYIISVNNIPSEAFVITTTDTVATVTTKMTEAINAVLDMPIIAVDGTTLVTFTSKWKGTSANDITVEVIGRADVGNVFTITQPVGGLVNPDVDIALAQVGEVWETLFLNCLDIADTTTLDKFQVFGEGRREPLVKKHMATFTGNTATTVALATAISDARKTDAINFQLVAPGSKNLPFVVAAAQLTPIAVLANNNPPHDYGSQKVESITPGTDAEQWTYADRDSAIKKGSSTIEVRDGVINISDIVSFYHPTGEAIPGYRYLVDLIKIQQVVFNLALIFNSAEWDGAPLVPDSQLISNPTAKKPKMAVMEIAAMLDSLGLEAIIADAAAAKETVRAQISPTNPKRLDVTLTAAVSGNSNIKSIDYNFGFFFGEQVIIG